jgi:hypothetical protein
VTDLLVPEENVFLFENIFLVKSVENDARSFDQNGTRHTDEFLQTADENLGQVLSGGEVLRKIKDMKRNTPSLMSVNEQHLASKM